MKKLTLLLGMILFCSIAVAHEKVVVIPLNSSSAKIPNNTSPCDSTTAGVIRWTGSDFEGCDGSFWGRIGLTANVPTVYSSGHVWMDRNLGASKVATSPDDAVAYGDLYQWGRGTDGHQKRSSSNTALNDFSPTDDPGHGNFIITNSFPVDWRSPQNNNLWHGVSGKNNPCPAGFRLPTITEWETEIDSWSSSDPEGAFNSPLKLVSAGYRAWWDGTIRVTTGNLRFGKYWSSTLSSSESWYLEFSSGLAGFEDNARARGCSVRCIKD